MTGVSLIAGAVLAGAGVYLLMTSRTDDERPSTTTTARPRRSGLRLAILPGGAVLGGEF